MQFAGSASEELATIEKDEYRVSFKPSSNAPAIQSQKHADNDNVYNNVSSIKTNAKVKLKTGSKEILASEYQKNQEYQAIKFEGIFNNKQDIVIQPSGDGVKEDIVLPSIPEQSEFSFEFTLENLYPVLLEDGNVWLLDRNTNEIAAAIPAPNMIDSSPEEHESYDIDVSMRKISDTKYLYTLIPNRDWLEEEGRVYPVRIDPSVTYTTSNMLDTFITSKYPNNNYANDANIKVGNSGDLGVSRGYFQLKNFPNAIGSGKVITSAKFTAWQNYNGASTVQIGLYPSIVDYNNSTITWSNRAWYADDPAATATVSSVKSYTWDVTSMIKNWYADSSQLRSFTMKNVDEGPNKYKRFGSAQYGTSSQRPKLVVNYTNPPSAPSSVTIKTTGWTKDKITVAWGTITQESSSTLSEVQYSTTSATSGFAKITNPSKLSGGSATLDLPEGKKYVWIRGKNARGQVGAATRSNVQYQRDRTAPNIPTSITGTPNFNGPIGSMTANWTATTDAGCGVDYYEVAMTILGIEVCLPK